MTCHSCHGSADSPAPPTDLSGNTATTFAGVGAHQKHLGASSWRGPIACRECHVVPTSIDSDPSVPTHMNGTDDLTWGPLAKAGTFDTKALTCTGTYCHGSTLAKDVTGATSQRTPVWNKVDGSQSACGTACHTTPPGGTHPASTACEKCHADVIASFTTGNPGKAVWKNAALHINGKVEVIDLNCTTCHGDPATGAAPPKGTKGETATTAAAVGAHAAHLGASTWHRAGACADCHASPTSTSHSNGKVDFAWGAPSTNDGAVPVFNATNLQCSSTYCHGSTLLPAAAGGQINRTPVWNKVDGSQSACGKTCHTNPPGGTHPASTACQSCHPKVIASFTPGNPPTVTWKDASLHINGTVEASDLTCTSCHGTGTNPAPPKGTKGETATSDPAVGAHERHLNGYDWHRAGQCSDCHTTPASMSHANGKVDFAWGAPSNADGALPSFSAAALTCSGTYCHGSTLMGAVSGGTVNRTPVWNVVNETWDACGTTCHTNPPGGTHPASTACQNCHGAVISSFNGAASTWKDPSLHVNGKVEVIAMSCTTCHGTGTNPAPPKGTKGETNVSDPAVGAHDRHLNGYNWHRAGACGDCHATPTSMSHANGVVDFSWGGPSNADGARSSFNTSALTCSGTYCHGSTLMGANAGGKVNRTPVWNVVNETWDACGTTCHTNPPGGTHPNSTACQSCHGDVIQSFNGTQSIWKNASLHVNGKVEVSAMNCSSCHGSSAPTLPPNDECHRMVTNSGSVDSCSACHGAGTSKAQAPSSGHNNGSATYSTGSYSGSFSLTFNAGNRSCSTNCHKQHSGTWGNCRD